MPSTPVYCWTAGVLWIESTILLCGKHWLEMGRPETFEDNTVLCLDGSSLASLVCSVWSALWEGVDCLPMVKPDATIYLEIRRGCCTPLQVCRPSVVFTEGSDPRLFEDGVKRPETCENGIQGVLPSGLVDGLYSPCGRKASRGLRWDTTKLGFECHGKRNSRRERSPSVWPCSGVRGDAVRNVVTWLILPVVICLSQRLSHACLSITTFVLGNCEWLIKSVIVYLMVPCYMDNCGNSRANTCNKAPTSGRGVFIR